MNTDINNHINKPVEILKSINIPLLIFSIVYYGIILYLADTLNIWNDEAISLHTSSGTVGYAFRQAFSYELQPPVYFVLLSLWRGIGESILWARLLSVVFIFIAQVYLYYFTLKISNRTLATLITIFFLVNPFTIYAILEIRLYALVILLSIMLCVTFCKYYLSETVKIHERIIFILISVLGLFTQYYIGFLLFAFAVVLLAEKKWKCLRMYILDMVIPLLLIILIIPLILQSAQSHQEAFLSNSFFPVFSFYDIKVFTSQSLSNIIPLFMSASEPVEFIYRVLVLGYLAIALDYTFLKTNLKKGLPALIIVLTCLIFFILLLVIFGKHSVVFRYLMVLFVSMLFFFVFLLRSMKPRFMFFLLLTLILFFINKDFIRYKDLYKFSDLKAIGSYIEEVEKPNEPILVFQNITAEALVHYYNGINMMIPLPDSVSYSENYDSNQWTISSEDIERIEGKLQHNNSFYLVVDNTFLSGIEESITFLLATLTNKYTLQFEKEFRGNTDLYRFTKKEFQDTNNTIGLTSFNSKQQSGYFDY